MLPAESQRTRSPVQPTTPVAATRVKPDTLVATQPPKLHKQAFSRSWSTSLPLITADALCISLTAGLIVLLLPVIIPTAEIALGPLAAALIICNSVVAYVLGLYPGVGVSPSAELRLQSYTTLIVHLILGVQTFFLHPGPVGQQLLVLAISFSLLTALLPLSRWTVRKVFARRLWWGEQVLIFGQGVQTEALLHYLRERPELGFRPWGVLGSETNPGWQLADEIYQGMPHEAAQLAQSYGISWAIIATGDMTKEEVAENLTHCDGAIPHRLLVSDLELPSLWNRTHDCAGHAGLQVTDKLLLPWPRFVKRSMDLVIAGTTAILFLPVIIALALLVRISSPGPIFYGQSRIGRGGRKFQAWKFRSMVPNADAVLERYLAENPALAEEYARNHKLKNDPRVTRIGLFLRKSSLDELPQLWNVLLGQMSLVGPRPITDHEVVKYDEVYRKYCQVRPGITGLWQVSGRSNTTYEERVALDAGYVRNWSPWLDLFILVRTVRTVLLREGAC